MVFRGLVQMHGAGEVFKVGEAILGYPPTWAHQLHEYTRVAAEFRRRRQEAEEKNDREMKANTKAD